MKTLVLLLLFLGIIPEVKAQLQFLGKTISEAKFLAVQSKIELSAEEELDEVRTIMTYKTVVKIRSGTSFTMNHYLAFDSQINDMCYLITSIPSLQGVKSRWVADTLISRLRRKGFKKVDGNTFTLENWVSKFEYVNSLDPITGKKTGIDIMRVNSKLIE